MLQFICQWENEPGGVPIRIKHLLHLSAVRYGSCNKSYLFNGNGPIRLLDLEYMYNKYNNIQANTNHLTPLHACAARGKLLTSPLKCTIISMSLIANALQ